MSTKCINAYRKAEKKWKKLKIADEKELYDRDSGACIPEAADLVDCTNLSSRQSSLQRVGYCETSPGWRRPIYSFINSRSTGDDTHIHSGFYVIPGALDDANQRLLAEHCLMLYPEAPHTTNLHPLKQQIEHIWSKSMMAKEAKEADPMAKLHWAALGFHYDWTKRTYPNVPGSNVPKVLQSLGSICAEAVGMSLNSEAVLVNYYKASSTMGGHQDDVELTFDHPVVSFSLGCSAVFLKGGLTKDEEPLEILLRSGDAVIMGGASRLSFHGDNVFLMSMLTSAV